MQKLSFSLIHFATINQIYSVKALMLRSIMSGFEWIVAIHLDFQLYHIHPTKITLNHTFTLFIPL